MTPGSLDSATAAVAIGRNEGERLRLCLESLVGRAAAVVYVDSGSTDASVELARSLGVEVVELDLSQPFTAARARNEGFARLQEILPAVQYVQMVDGDCEVVDGWLDTAAAALAADDKLAVVCGRRRERHPDASIYNRLCDMEWDTPVGPARSCGGDALFRAAALTQIGGYDPTVIAGEEPELCVRLRQAGWRIERLDAEMTLHDAALTRFGQWWKRNVRAGHAYAQGAAMHGKTDGHNVKQVRSILVWGLVAPLLTLAALAAAAVELALRPGWVLWVFWLAVFFVNLSMFVQLSYRIQRYRRSRGDAPLDASVYARFTVLGKLANAAGVLQYRKNRLLNRRAEIIEYKSAARPGPTLGERGLRPTEGAS
ncbi:MAG: glycosyltransferase [Planctomycetota bacterium]